MQYFVIVSRHLKPRNNLQKSVDFLAQRWHRVLTSDPYRVIKDLNAVLADAQRRHPRSKNLRIVGSETSGFRQGMHLFRYYVGEQNNDSHMVSVSLYKVAPEPLPLVTDAPVAPTSDEIEAMAGGIWIGDNNALDDGNLINMRLGYQAMAETRRAGNEIEHLGEPFRSYPAEVWERCTALAETEIKRRASSGKEVGDEPND